MTTMFNPSRDQVRQFFCDTYRKWREGAVLSGAEVPAADIIALHPEYHALLADPDALGREWTPEQGAMNPFLHLSLHLAVAEQLSIDQPRGIRAAYDGLRRRLDDEHDALHRLLECLGEAVWKAQRNGGAMDAEGYLDSIRRSAPGA